MQELGLPEERIGSAPAHQARRLAVISTRPTVTGGSIERGVVVNSGCLNPDLMKGKKGGRGVWAKASLRDRIDAIIAHEYEELRMWRSFGCSKSGCEDEAADYGWCEEDMPCDGEMSCGVPVPSMAAGFGPTVDSGYPARSLVLHRSPFFRNRIASCQALSFAQAKVQTAVIHSTSSDIWIRARP